MDHTVPANFTCSELIQVKDYFKKFTKELEFTNDVETFELNLDTKEEYVSFLGVRVPAKQYEQLSDLCCIRKLNHIDEIRQTADKEKIAKGRNLLVSNVPSGHLKIQKAKDKWHNVSETWTNISYPIEREEMHTLAEDLTPNKDIVVIVRFYKPFKYHSIAWKSPTRYTHEFAITAKQTLADLRDIFKCVNDFGSSIEIEHPDDIVPIDLKDEYPSGFIFIENCFYNDMRHPNAIEYSKEILEWAKRKNISNYTTANMEKTKIMDLKIRIGYPYVYQHQANCQHLVVFTDMRLLRQDELRMSRRYPYVLSHEKFNRKTCMMCRQSIADYVVTDCERLLAKFNYLCKKCLLIYNYKDGQKIGSDLDSIRNIVSIFKFPYMPKDGFSILKQL